MTRQELYENWKMFGGIEGDKSLYIEYIRLCNFISDEDFYYYLNPNKATEAQFLSVMDFLYQQKCYMLLYRYLRDNKARLIYPDFEAIQEMEIQEKIEERLKKLQF